MSRRCVSVLIALFLTSAPLCAQETKLDTAAIEKMSGLKGALIPEENVFKIGKPRNDVKIVVDEWEMPPFMGLGSWAAFIPAHGQTMMMGDTVVFEDEVNPAMSAALEAGLEVTALHNHFFFDSPKVYFMHIGGMGDAGQLAAGVKKVYDTISDIRKANPEPARSFPRKIATPSKIAPWLIEENLGAKGQESQGMYKVVIGRSSTMHGTKVGKEMGINTWASFAGDDADAVVDGDFVMTATELQPVLKAMRKEGINIVAIHQHMSHEEPRLLFLHYWGKGPAQTLAQALKRVLDTQRSIQ